MTGLALFQLPCMWCGAASDSQEQLACGPAIGKRFVFSLVGESLGSLIGWGGLGLGGSAFLLYLSIMGSLIRERDWQSGLGMSSGWTCWP